METASMTIVSDHLSIHRGKTGFMRIRATLVQFLIGQIADNQIQPNLYRKPYPAHYPNKQEFMVVSKQLNGAMLK
jgi:hypothetical protein